MKYTAHIPTESYGFIEVEGESYEEVNEAYRAIKCEWEASEGLPSEEFDAFIQRQLSGETNHVEDWNRMSPEQQKYVQINKRAINRINYKAKK